MPELSPDDVTAAIVVPRSWLSVESPFADPNVYNGALGSLGVCAHWGDSAFDEMCFINLSVYPAIGYGAPPCSN